MSGDHGGQPRGHTRAFIGGLVAVSLGFYGQWLITHHRALDSATRSYAAAIVVLLVSWHATQRHRGRLEVALSASRLSSGGLEGGARGLFFGRSGGAAGLLVVAVAVNLASVAGMRVLGYESWLSGLAWLGSLVLLVIAGLRVRGSSGEGREEGRDTEHYHDGAIDKRVEAALFLLTLVASFALRFYRLGDWTTGVHGDEGEAGMEALAILEGARVSPFASGWFAQPNFYYWGIALCMKLFGTGLFGLRMFSATAGAIMVVPLYLLLRLWFGVRAAVVGGALLAVSDVAIHFSRQEFSNITTPLFLVTGSYFFFRGLRRRRAVDFVLAGFGHMLSLYFYAGGRLTPLMMAAFLGYLFVLMPFVRVLGAAWSRAGSAPARALARVREALVRERRRVCRWLPHAVLYAAAAACLATPWLAYYLEHRGELDSRAREKLIFNNEERMVAQHGVSHEPLYFGLRRPQADDALPLPIGFEKTALSVQVAEDGFWPRVLWVQLRKTLSMLTYRFEASSIYTFTQEAVTKPVEAVLVILGLAWALWRWRDARMAHLSIWFWSTIVAGGVLTIDAPYMARVVGIIPLMSIAAALVVDKLAGESIGLARRWGARRGARFAQTATAASIALLLGFLAWQNAYDYYVRYVGPWSFTAGSGQAIFVREMNERLEAEGRPVPRYYHLGVHYIYWGYGPNRFLNHGTPGADVPNVAELLPLVDDEERDAVFMVWPVNQHYLPLLRHYYPGGEELPFHYGHPDHEEPLLVGYWVTRDEIRSRRGVRASYGGTQGRVVERVEGGLGDAGSRPRDLGYPAAATWSGALVAPEFGPYRFVVRGGDDPRLTIDDAVVIGGADSAGPGELAEVVLAKGVHEIRFEASLRTADEKAEVLWSRSGPPSPIPSRYLWLGDGRALLGDVRRLDSPTVTEAGRMTPAEAPLAKRVDGFLGFRDTRAAFRTPLPVSATWSGVLRVPEAGRYQFATLAGGGETRVTIDGQLVVENVSPGGPKVARGDIQLEEGSHDFELSYLRSADSGYLELFWIPPSGDEVMLGPEALEPTGGAWPPDQIVVPPPGRPGAATHGAVPASAFLLRRSTAPYGLALGPSGEIYVADRERHDVTVLEPDGTVRRRWGGRGTAPGRFGDLEDVAVAPDGRVYVLESRPPRVQVFSQDGSLERVVGGDGWCSPGGLAADAEGSIYVAETCASRVLKLDGEGTVVQAFDGGAAHRFEQPVDVALGEDGAVYTVDLHDRLMRIEPRSGAIEITSAVHVGRALGAANLDVKGSVAVLSDPDRSVLYRIDLSSGEVDELEVTVGLSLQTPLGVALASDGRIYVGDVGRGGIVELEAP